ncbi:MAG: hypothetical protein DAHOPDDO_00591 [Ignavibacteriaceae bacterium]|nr:hypothetical protein [Ignavibacteriaceae bacterium]
MILNSKYNPWDAENLPKLFDIVTGSTPSTKEEKYWSDGKLIWVTPTDLSQTNGDIFISNSERKISEAALDHSNLTLLPVDSILLSTRAPVGYVAINKRELCFNQGCKGLMIKEKDLVDPLFYYYYFSFIKGYLESISGGSTFKELSKDSLKNLSLPVPSKQEQTAIANILSTVDEAIQKADEAITKTERIKQALLQKLLTEGIGHTEFKETKIGKIPKDWDLKKLSSLAELKNGINFTKQQKGDKGILVVDVLNMYGPSINLDYSNLYKVNKKISLDSDYILQKGDLLFVRSSLKREGAGWVSLFNGFKENVTYCGFIIRARLKSKDILPEFATFYLRSSIARRFILASAGQVVITNVSQDNISSVNIPIPPVNEQIKIISILQNFDNKIELLKNRKSSYERIKQGLMDDLLTGRKRVKLN